MARSILKRLRVFVFLHPRCSILVSFLIIWTLLPLRLPNWLEYKKINLSDTLDDLESCPIEVPKQGDPCILNLKTLGAIPIHVQKTVNASQLEDLEKITQAGGAWQSKTCQSQHRVAIIIPYRERPEQLKIFLQHIHPFLQNQKLDYQVFIIEQSKAHDFNRGKLFNIGFQEALKLRNFCCFIFHDVDLLPESPEHVYSCSKMPRHMSSAIDIFRYVLPYPSIFGGVIAVSRQHFLIANGYSNKFFGWGAEDDDLSQRLHKKGLDIVRWDPSISRYTMLSHKKAKPNPRRKEMLEADEDLEDGLSGLKFNVLDRELRPLYTWILVDVKPTVVNMAKK